MIERFTTLLFESPVSSLSATLVAPIAMTVWFRSRALHANEPERPAKWILYSQWLQVICLCTVAVWWSLWDLHRVSVLERGRLSGLMFLDPELLTVILFFGLPVGATAVARLIASASGRTFFATKWSSTDLLRLTFWGTASTTLVFLMVAKGFDAACSRSLTSFFWLVGAAILQIIGVAQFRMAQGIIFRRVRSGEVYKRAFSLAGSMGINLKRVYVVPVGRGHLANAHGWPRSIAVTENYGKFLHGPELDFVIGHELSHGKELHGIKNLVVAPMVLSVLVLASFLFPSTLEPLRPILDIAVILMPVLINRFISRRFEYAAESRSGEASPSKSQSS